MSYYNYNSLFGSAPAQDRVRNVKLPAVGPTLDILDEAFTSENWIVRIYKVKDLDKLGRDHTSVSAFESGKAKRKNKRTQVKGARRLRLI